MDAGSASPILPPLVHGLRLAADGVHPLDHACDAAAHLGAGTLVWAERPGVLALAVVLEPDCALAPARLVLYAGLSALAEAVAACAAPERSVTLVWPDGIAYDAARLGGGTLVWPAGAAEDAVPDWLVFGAEVIGDRDALDEPGRFRDSTSLAEEQIGPVAALIEGFGAHLMRNFDTWTVQGPAALAARYLGRLAPAPDLERRIAPNGDLLERSAANVVVRRSLLPALAAREWYDARRGGPRL